MQLEGKGDFSIVLPAILREQRRTGSQVGERRGVRGRGLGPLPRDQVEFGKLVSLVPCSDEGSAAVELIDDVEDRVPPLLRRRVCHEQAADPQMLDGLIALGDKRIGRLLNAIVQEPVGALQPQHEPGPDRFPECRMQRSLVSAVNHGQGADGGTVAEASEMLQCGPGRRGQAAQLAQQEIHHVIGVTLGVDALDIPRPVRCTVVEGEQPLLGQCGEELDDKEGVAASLCVHQPGQRRSVLRLAAQCVDDETPHVLEVERCQHDLLHPPPGAADRCQPPNQGVRWRDFVVPVGPHQEQVAQLGPGRQMLEQIERGRVEPLQVVEEQRQRMLGPGEDAEEVSEHQLEAALRILRRQLRHRWLRTDEQFQLGDEGHDELSVWTQRLPKGLAPERQLGLALCQKVTDQALERLRQSRIRDVTLVLVELAGGEQPAGRHQHLMELMNDRGLANAGIAGHQHQLRSALGHDPVEGGEQGLDLGLASIEPLRDEEPVRQVPCPQRKGFDPAVGLPLHQAVPQVGLQPAGGLVALLGSFGEQLQDNSRDRLGNAGQALSGWYRLPGEVAMHPFHRFAGRKRQSAREHLIEGCPESIKIAARVDRAIHAPSLFGRHVGECAGDCLGWHDGLPLAGQARGEAETGEPSPPGRGRGQDIGRVDILVDEGAPVDLAHGCGDPDGQLQEAAQLHRPIEKPRERLAAGILDHQHGLSAFAYEFQRPCGPGTVQVVPQAVFVREALEAGGGQMRRGRPHGQNRLAHAVGVEAPSTTENPFAVLPQNLEATPLISAEPGTRGQRSHSAIKPGAPLE